jgi:boron transporter
MTSKANARPPRQPRFCLFADAAADAKARLGCYRDDFRLSSSSSSSASSPARLLIPASINVLVASALPAVAFGVQLAAATGGQLTPAHVLLSTAVASVLQALLGGQPLLVVGVAEPIVLVWAFLAEFCARQAPAGGGEEEGSGGLPYLPFCACACAWAALMLLALSALGACNRAVRYFSRFSGETFGTVIALLFAAVGVKGLAGEFRVLGGGSGENLPEGAAGAAEAAAAAAPAPASAVAPTPTAAWTTVQLQLLGLCNGLWAVIVALGTASTAWLVVGRARLWHCGWPCIRAALADYGTLLSVVIWTAVSYAVRVVVVVAEGGKAGLEVGGGGGHAAAAAAVLIPRRVPSYSQQGLSALARGAATTAPGMAALPGWAVAAALVPGLVVAVLFWFDHTVSARLAHDAGGHPLRKPTAYDWDLGLCALLTLALGLLGLPPTNGVIPQTPILARSLRLRAGGGRSAAAAAAMPSATTTTTATLALPTSSASAAAASVSAAAAASFALPPPHPPPAAGGWAVLESRWPNLAQGVLCAALLLPLAPLVLPLVPMSVVYGFFLFLAVEPLASMQLWREQVWALLTDGKTRARTAAARRRRAAAAAGGTGEAAPPPPPPPMAAVALLTCVQLSAALGVALLALLGGIGGVAFPVPLALLVPLRRWGLPWLFGGGGGSGVVGGRRRALFGGPAALEALDPLLEAPGAMLALEDEVEAAAEAEADEEEQQQQQQEGAGGGAGRSARGGGGPAA